MVEQERCEIRWRSKRVVGFLRLIFTCPLREKSRKREIPQKRAPLSVILYSVAENVTAKLDLVMERLEKLSLIESRLNSMANIESTRGRLDADVTVLKEGAI